MRITLPNPCLVVLVGASGAGKSSFARRHFIASEVVSSDFCRGLVSDDENSLEATTDAFALLHYITEKRLNNLKITVIDATNVQAASRQALLKLARKHHLFTVAIVLNVAEAVCQERNERRPDRNFGPHVVRNHLRELRGSLRFLEREGFRRVFILNGVEEVEKATIEREPLFNDRRDLTGPFDIIGDVHGCGDELEALLAQLGYERDESGTFRHSERMALFVGDLVDRGPRVADVLDIVQHMVSSGAALCVRGNHDDKVLRFLEGKHPKVTHGLATSIADLEARDDEFHERMRAFLDGLISHYVLDEGRLVIAHAGCKAEFQGRSSGTVRSFCMYGETTGETDEFGLPVRYPWAQDYRGKAAVVYGHTPVPRAQWLNNTIDIDTGCVFGGKLTALRWPERELIEVPALQTYAEPARPLGYVDSDSVMAADEVLDFADVSGKRILENQWMNRITIGAEQGAAALEVLSRFGTDPRWLIHLPPTMSPTATAPAELGLLEHPSTVWSYFRENGINTVVCEEKHMGSRAVAVVCRDEKAALRRFGIVGESGAIWTRTGRRFFDDLSMEGEVLERLRSAMTRLGWWEEFNSDWFCLDAELMPWSAKAQELITRQYAPVADAGASALAVAHAALEATAHAGIDVANWQSETAVRKEAMDLYRAAFERYCWPVASVEDLKFAPFHLLASEGTVHIDKPHVWHMETLAKLSLHEPICVATPFKTVDLTDAGAVADAENWWGELTSRGGEGMVVKPLDWVNHHDGRLVQPALKCRGPEYLRIIYGPEYLLPQNLERLRKRGLGAKRSLALREWALGVEALNRFVAGEGLRRVHECVWGVLALESEPVDPRL
ncbi:bis(5'-nucleosyl)-tetraphosphatase PrpE [asymmetrical] [Abditibacteriota bacterium]|nr:bis(5'-nucleosyl)-tetraphosphatase PrpE [asymmetrical] [Abditibacteriota bacterium]